VALKENAAIVTPETKAVGQRDIHLRGIMCGAEVIKKQAGLAVRSGWINSA